MSDPDQNVLPPQPSPRLRPESTRVLIDDGDGNPPDEDIPQLPEPILLYFKPRDAGDSVISIHFDSTSEAAESIVVDASQKITRFAVDTPSTEEILNVSIAMNMANLNIDLIDYISFRHYSDDTPGAPEAFTGEELKARCVASNTLELGLHRQRISGDQYFEMKIQVLPGVNPEDVGRVELISMTLQVAPLDARDVNVHPSRLVSIDVTHRQSMDPGSSVMPARIVHYSVSGNDNYVATLSYVSPFFLDELFITKYSPAETNQVYMDEIAGVEDAPQIGVSVSYDASRITVIDSAINHLEEPFQVFGFKGPVIEGSLPTKGSLSRITEIKDEGIHAKLKDFRGFGKFHSTSSRETNVDDELFITCDGLCVNIYSIQGQWELLRTITLSKEDPVKKPWRLVEGIGGCNFSWSDLDNNLHVCDLGTGKLVYSLPSFYGTAYFSRNGSLMMCLQSSGTITARWTQSGSVLAMTDMLDNGVPTCYPTFIKDRNHAVILADLNNRGSGHESVGILLDTMTHALVGRASSQALDSVGKTQGAGSREQYFFSCHGSKLDLVHLHEDVTSNPRPRHECNRECLDHGVPAKVHKFVTQSYDFDITLGASYSDQDLDVQEAGAHKYALTMSFSDKSQILGETIGIPWFPVTKHLMAYEYHVDKASRLLIIDCGCLIMIWKLPVISGESAVLQSAWWIQRDLPRVTGDTHGDPSKDTIEKSNQPRGELVKCWREWIHPRTREGYVSKMSILPKNDPFDSDTNSLFRGLPNLIPAIFGESTVSQSAWWTQKDPPKVTSDTHRDSPKDTRKNSDHSRSELVKCSHEWIHTRTRAGHISEMPMLPENDPFDCDTNSFFRGLYIIISGFGSGNDGYRQAVLQYIDRYINRTTILDGQPTTILATLCNQITNNNYAVYDTFLRVLFDSRYIRWVPMPGLSHEMNPIWILLEKVKEVPRIVQLIEYATRYCTRMAKAEKDPNFVSPIADMFPYVFKKKNLHPGLMSGVLRGLTYVPTMGGRININHCINPSWRILSRCEIPVAAQDPPLPFQSRCHDNDHFIRDVFVVPFNLLWRPSDSVSDDHGRSPIERIIRNCEAPRSTLLMILCEVVDIPMPSKVTFKIASKLLVALVFWYILVLAEAVYVCWIVFKALVTFVAFHSPKDTPQWLDNPAIAAWIEQTAGFKFWLISFIYCCAMYASVLAAVYIQVYDSEKRRPLGNVFLLIWMLGFIFLGFELIKSKRGASVSVMNIICYTLPIIASFQQLHNIKTKSNGAGGFLSFSVLLLSLNFLYHLQISRNMCYFLRIINRTLERTRPLFLIFGIGILAFTFAILHVLHDCSISACEKAKEAKFPIRFFQALSSTYFFMGGVWDPVLGDLVNDNWKFQVMMMLYYFFASVLLLNILIGLVNEEFGRSHETALQASLAYKLQIIEETHTQMIINTLDVNNAHAIERERIYYFATLKEQKDYHNKWDTSEFADFDTGSRGQVLKNTLNNSMTATYPTTAREGRAAVSEGAIIHGLKESTQQGGDDQPGLGRGSNQALKKELLQSQEQMIARLKDQLQEERSVFQAQTKAEIRALQDRLQESQGRSEAVLREQLQEQQRLFETQITDMKDSLVAALTALAAKS
ncbi:hypothetical protein BGX34_005930 [Mortierella sp. NVP85]|nr:hypothetical protein BGX34_005930 [Mortierella sp. NVP85]